MGVQEPVADPCFGHSTRKEVASQNSLLGTVCPLINVDDHDDNNSPRPVQHRPQS